MTDRLKRLRLDDRGTSLAEYALLAGLIALAAFAAVAGMGTNVNALLENVWPS